MGAISVLLVLLCLTILVALIGGAGVAFGIAAAAVARARFWLVVGGAVGGFLVGAIVKLLGLDAFTLLIGRSPGDITGPFEGLILGARRRARRVAWRAASRRSGGALSLRRSPAPSVACSLPCSAGG